MAAAKPNVLFVICDDLGFGDLACHGNPIVRTPHLDALHADSRRFTRYRSGPLCTPARAEVMTGKYHLRTGAIDTYLGRSDLRPGHRTLADHLSAAGYRTGCFGKWHLGDHAGCRPHERGFDVAVWHPSGGLGQPGDVPGNTYFNPQLLAPDTPRRCPGYCTDAITDAALDFIAEQSPDRPWFAYVGFNAPHTPLEIPDAWADRYRSGDLPEPFARLYAMIENIDANVGRLVDHLRTAGTLDDTLVVFTSDHGLQFTPDVAEQRFNAGLRASKGTMYEGGLRVPCLARLPSAGWVGGVDDERVATPIDWLPTFTQLAGNAIAEDGRSLLEPADADRVAHFQWHRGERPIHGRNCAVITPDWKWTRPAEDRPPELYRLPDETDDVITQHPDVAERLAGMYDAWFADVTADATVYDPHPIPLGDPREPNVHLSWQDWHPYDQSDGGWSRETPGWWPIDVVEGGPLRFTIEVDRMDMGRDVELRWPGGGTRVTGHRQVTTLQTEATLPRTAGKLEAFITDEDNRRIGVTRMWVDRPPVPGDAGR